MPSFRSVVATFSGPTARKGMLSLLSQGFLSLANLAPSLLLLRLAPRDESGAYVTALALVLALTELQGPLITGPMGIFAPPLGEAEARPYLSRIVVASAGLALLTVVVGEGLLGTLWLLGLVGTPAATVFAAAIAAGAFSQLRDMARRALFSRLKVAEAVAGDLAFALIQGGGAALLWAAFGGSWNPADDDAEGALTATRVLTLTVVAAAAATGLDLFALRGLLGRPRGGWRETARRHWGFGKWSLFAAFLAQGYSTALIWVTAALWGNGETPALDGPKIVVGPAVLLLVAWANVINSRGAQVYHERGRAAALRLVVVGAVPILALFVAFSATLVLFGPWIAGVVYEWRDQRATEVFIWWGPILLCMVVSTLFSCFLNVCHRPQVTFWSKLGTAPMVAAGTLLLIPAMGSTGAVATRLLAEGAMAVVAAVCALRYWAGLSPDGLGRRASVAGDAGAGKALPGAGAGVGAGG
ncbi:MAG: hypothetical protein HY719_07905 [Planctomycetes bacterium]|nr:hypothetical protein [Planctomycetota bacterium]